MKRHIILFSLLFSSLSFAKTDGPDLQLVLAKIHKASLVKFNIEKKTKSELLNKETISPGIIYVSANKFRWDTEGDEKSKIIYDGLNIWTIQEPPKGFKAPPQITKMKLDKKSESQVFLSNLFQDNFKTQFKITKKIKNDKIWDFYLKPLQKNLGINELIIKISDKGELKQISYIDEIQNKILIDINKTTLLNKKDAKLFQFKPPTGSQVNEL